MNSVHSNDVTILNRLSRLLSELLPQHKNALPFKTPHYSTLSLFLNSTLRSWHKFWNSTYRLSSAKPQVVYKRISRSSGRAVKRGLRTACAVYHPRQPLQALAPFALKISQGRQ